MERSVTPWRALDDDLAANGSVLGPTTDSVGGASPDPRTWLVLGGVAAAAALAIVAAWLVIAGPTPVAIVQTGTAPVVAGADDGASGPATTGAPGEIVVHVAGAVRRPGLVRLATGSRVGDAIEAAGGLGPRVDAARLGAEVNLAAVVADGDRVVVPSRDDAVRGAGAGGEAPSGSGAVAQGGGGPIDLNSASAEALESLPGIGEVTAARIVEARNERPFASLDELLERKVVGPATLAKIRDLVVVR